MPKNQCLAHQKLWKTIIVSKVRKKMKKVLAFFGRVRYNVNCASGCGSAWLERRLREAEVASSNPATPIKLEPVCEETLLRTLRVLVLSECSLTIKKNLYLTDEGSFFVLNVFVQNYIRIVSEGIIACLRLMQVLSVHGGCRKADFRGNYSPSEVN